MTLYRTILFPLLLTMTFALVLGLSTPMNAQANDALGKIGDALEQAGKDISDASKEAWNGAKGVFSDKPAEDAIDAREVLLLLELGEGLVTTSRIRPKGEGWEQVLEYPLAVIAHEEKLYAVETTEHALVQCDCGALMGSGEDWYEQETCNAFLSAGAQSSMRLVPLEGGDPIIVHEAPTQRDISADMVESHSLVNFSGLVGPYLLTVSYNESYGCGAAHGSHGSAYHVFDLRSGKDVTWGAWEEIDGIALPLKRKVLPEFRDAFVERVEDLAVTAIFPIYEAEQGLVADYQITGDACYACSDGWSAYSLSRRVKSTALPNAWMPYKELPAALQAWLKDNNGGELRGWSIAPTPQKLTENAPASLPAEAEEEEIKDITPKDDF